MRPCYGVFWLFINKIVLKLADNVCLQAIFG